MCNSRHFLYLPKKSLSFPPNSLVPHINPIIFPIYYTNPLHFHPICLYAILITTFSLPPLSFPPNFSIYHTNPYHFYPIRLYPDINHHIFPTPLSFPPNFSIYHTNPRHFHPIRLYPILITSFSLPRLQISIISTQFAYTPY